MKKKRQWFMCLGMIGVFTASVILSVFGQRKVKAQLNTENAGKITSCWADEKHIFSSFDDEKALSVDASYGFKMHATDQTKTIIEAGKKAASRRRDGTYSKRNRIHHWRCEYWSQLFYAGL